MTKKTPLYQHHIQANGKMVEFAGYLLPVNYSQGILYEHDQVRNNVGMFDVSHMGEITVKGKNALAFLENCLSNNVSCLKQGAIRYTVMCNKDGGCIDDLLLYCLNSEEYLLVVNAANRQKDYDYLKGLAQDVEVKDVSDSYCQLAIQGPNSYEVLKDELVLPNNYFTFIEDQGLIISRTGYTGEDGFEVYGPEDKIIRLWERLINKGVNPCGLGCRDTLRFEAGLSLYGHEITETISPKEAGLDFILANDKDFIGKQAIFNKEKQRYLIGLQITERGIARSEAKVFYQGQEAGFITSGIYSPTYKKALANALISAEYQEKTEFMVEQKNRLLKAKVAKLPFYKRERK